MRSPVVAMLWENWRLIRAEAAWRLSLSIVGGLAAFVVVAAAAPNQATRDFSASVALFVLISLNFMVWVAIAKLKGGRLMDGYRPGFPLYLLYTRPLRTTVLVAVPMVSQAALGAAVYLVSALVLRLTLDYPFPLLSVAAPIAAAHLAYNAADWATRSKAVQWLASTAAIGTLGAIAARRWQGWPTFFDFSSTDYAFMAAMSVASFGVTVAGVARQRHGSAPAATPRVAVGGFPDWLVDRFQFRCPTSSATRAQVWFDLRSSGLPVLTLGVGLAIVIPLVFVATTQLDLVLSRFITQPATRLVAVVVAVFSVPTVLILLAGNAFGIRAKQGRTYASAFEATQACGTARMAGLKVLVRSVCLLGALLAVGTSIWTSASVIPFDVLGDNDTLIEKSRAPLSGWMRAIRSGVGAMSADEVLMLAFVTCTLVAVMVAWRAADAALRARYQRRQRIAGSVLLLYALVLGLLAVAGERGIGPEIPLGAILEATKWIAAVAMVLATGYLSWNVFEERLLTLRQASSAILFSAAFGMAWVTVLGATGVSLAGMPTTDAAWMRSPALLPLLVSLLAPWSLSRVRHT
ncbi:MAG TPA: hypothetical protein VFO21_24380 [Vicinamibacterales bacterium]|nr:hypothetical protein [Vicinamibacterales bacterium]